MPYLAWSAHCTLQTCMNPFPSIQQGEISSFTPKVWTNIWWDSTWPKEVCSPFIIFPSCCWQGQWFYVTHVKWQSLLFVFICHQLSCGVNTARVPPIRKGFTEARRDLNDKKMEGKQSGRHCNSQGWQEGNFQSGRHIERFKRWRLFILGKMEVWCTCGGGRDLRNRSVSAVWS